jgi:DNA-binding PadR family transcriptional regulator
LADKSSRMLIDALTRASLEPDGALLLSSKVEEGLFPPTSVAKRIADRCKEEGLLEVVRLDQAGKKSREIALITDKGRELLKESANPQQLLEDFLRLLERREEQISSLQQQVTSLYQSIRATHEMLGQYLPDMVKLPPKAVQTLPETIAEEPKPVDIKQRILGHLSNWQKPGDAIRDCPLPQLFQAIGNGCTIGQFHDELRGLDKLKKITLHPWTGPLYLLPMPAFALLIGHQIAYYASLSVSDGSMMA